MTKQIIEDVQTRMNKSLEAIKHELATVRTGKALPSILDQVHVDAYGSITPLNQVASINAPDVRMLVVQPWDKNLLGEVVKGIQKEDLGLNPQVDGNVIRIPIPDLTEERRVDLVKLARKMVEEGKIAFRNVRRDANDRLKKQEKEKELTSDLMHDAMNEVQKLTDKFTEDLEKLLAEKEKEVMQV